MVKVRQMECLLSVHSFCRKSDCSGDNKERRVPEKKGADSPTPSHPFINKTVPETVRKGETANKALLSPPSFTSKTVNTRESEERRDHEGARKASRYARSKTVNKKKRKKKGRSDWGTSPYADPFRVCIHSSFDRVYRLVDSCFFFCGRCEDSVAQSSCKCGIVIIYDFSWYHIATCSSRFVSSLFTAWLIFIYCAFSAFLVLEFSGVLYYTRITLLCRTVFEFRRFLSIARLETLRWAYLSSVPCLHNSRSLSLCLARIVFYFLQSVIGKCSLLPLSNNFILSFFFRIKY